MTPRGKRRFPPKANLSPQIEGGERTTSSNPSLTAQVAMYFVLTLPFVSMNCPLRGRIRRQRIGAFNRYQYCIIGPSGPARSAGNTYKFFVALLSDGFRLVALGRGYFNTPYNPTRASRWTCSEYCARQIARSAGPKSERPFYFFCLVWFQLRTVSPF